LITRDALQFNPASDTWLDVAAFTGLFEENKTNPTSTENLEQALSLYQGSFLEGFSVSDCPPFEQWILLTRARLAQQVTSALHILASNYEASGNYQPALAYARRQLDLEPWDEIAHQQMIRILAFTGQRSAALAQYQTCRRTLADELEVEPSRETTELYEQIRDGRLNGPVPPPFSQSGPPASIPFFSGRSQFQRTCRSLPPANRSCSSWSSSWTFPWRDTGGLHSSSVKPEAVNRSCSRNFPGGLRSLILTWYSQVGAATPIPE